MNEEVKHPNSTRYWRLNSIEGIRMELMGCCYPASDPEEHAERQRLRAELGRLRERERQVQERFKRMQARTSRVALAGTC